MTTPTRVLHVLETAQFAGTEAHVLALLGALDPDRVRVSLLPLPHSPLHERAQAAGIPCIGAAGVPALARHLRRTGCQIVHAHDGAAKFKAVAAAALAATGARVVATQHFIRPAYTQRTGWTGAAGAAAHRIVNRRLRMTIAISQAVHEGILRRGEAPEHKVTVIPNGIALPPLESLPPPDAVRGGLGVPLDAPLVVCAARLEREKDVGTLVEAMAVVVAAWPEAICLVAGQGSQEAPLRSWLSGIGLDKSVRLLGFRKDVHAVIRAGDVFVLPSLAEPFGLVLLEAMALGRPVIATRAGGPLDIVVEGQTGLLYPPGDTGELAWCLTALLADPVMRQSFGSAGQQRMQERFTADVMARATEAVYSRCRA